MGNELKRIITIDVFGSCIFLIIYYFFSNDITLEKMFDIVPTILTIVLVIDGIYVKHLWKYDRFLDIPNLNGKYSCEIKSSFDGFYDTKNAYIEISQTLISMNIKITTNEIVSHSISSKVVKENDTHILYYNYLTNPQTQYLSENPIQYGSCRLEVSLQKNKLIEMKGTYWTTSKTIGEIALKKLV